MDGYRPIQWRPLLGVLMIEGIIKMSLPDVFLARSVDGGKPSQII